MEGGGGKDRQDKHTTSVVKTFIKSTIFVRKKATVTDGRLDDFHSFSVATRDARESVSKSSHHNYRPTRQCVYRMRALLDETSRSLGLL